MNTMYNYVDKKSNFNNQVSQIKNNNSGVLLIERTFLL